MNLIDRFLLRHRDIESRLCHWQPDFDASGGSWPTRRHLALSASNLLATALDLPDGDFTSWLPGVPLAALLISGRRITTDIAPSFLFDRRPSFGVPDQALFEFGRSGMLLFNIRDFDPSGSQDELQRQIAPYLPWQNFLHQLLDEAWDSVYFLSSIRPRLFDVVPNFGQPAADGALRDRFARASEDLALAATASLAVPVFDAEAINAQFRGERTAATASCWHWAYVQSMQRYVDFDFGQHIREEYESFRAMRPGDETVAMGRRFLAFQTRMRFAHLVYSAPISASFGGPYGYSLNDDHVFMQAVERQFRWTASTPFEYDYFEDDLLDLMQDLQAGQLRTRFAQHLNGRNWERLRDLGTEVYARTEPVSYFEHYSDVRNRQELISYWQEWSLTRRNYAQMEDEAEALLGEDEIDPTRLFELAAQGAKARSASDQALRRHTEGFQIRINPPAGMRMSQDRITATDPKHANLLLRALVWLGLKRSNGDIAVGKYGDHSRVAYGTSRNFRDNPR